MIFCIPVYGIARISPSEIDTREYNTKGDCVPNYRENFLWFCNIWLGRIILEEKKSAKISAVFSQRGRPSYRPPPRAHRSEIIDY